MATLTVRNVDPETHDFLRRRAAEHGRSMEAEVRALLTETRDRGTRRPAEVAASIRARFAGLGAPEAAERAPLGPPVDLG